MEDMLEDMEIAKVPEKYVEKLVEESDTYYEEIYLDLKDQLIEKKNYSESQAKKILKEIFGNFKAD